MAKLSTSQLSSLAESFLKMAQTVGEYRVKNHSTLSRKESLEIKDLHRKLLDYADRFYTTSATLQLENVKDSLKKINEITEKVNRTYKSLRSFQKAIDIDRKSTRLNSSH